MTTVTIDDLVTQVDELNQSTRALLDALTIRASDIQKVLGDDLSAAILKCNASAAALINIAADIAAIDNVHEHLDDIKGALAAAQTAIDKASEAGTSAATAAQSATTAQTAAQSAATSEQTAIDKAVESYNSAQSAAQSAATATTKASEADTSAQSAATSAQTAIDKATEAGTSASASETSATTAKSAAQIATAKAAEAASYANSAGYKPFRKSVRATRLFTAPTATTIAVTQDFYASVGTTVFSITAGTALVMPTLVAGTDYAFYLCSDGILRADSSFTAPTGYTTATSQFIGCGHYAPGGNAAAQAGGNAAAQAGGNTTPAFNPYSLFDLTYRPRRSDWRGMTTDPGANVCGMIYKLNADHIVNGPSAYNKTIADNVSPPKIPIQFGGNGSTTYTYWTYFSASEVLSTYGMRLPFYHEFAALAYGTTEGTSIGSDQGRTILNAAYTSRCGVIQATGVQWEMGANFGGGSLGTSWWSTAENRGQAYNAENFVLFGGHYNSTSAAGSEGSLWNTGINGSSIASARGVCDLLILD